MRLVCLTLASVALATAAPKTATPAVTFNRDVLPILQKNCQGCHRPGEAAPMSFLTYKDTRPWAKAIRQAVLQGKMPPWFADPHIGKWANDRSLSKADIDTIAQWADNGAVEGDSKDKAAPRQFIEGWNIGKPDYQVEMPMEYKVPASGTIEYTYFVVPTGFTEDRWVQAAEARPGNRRVVHHIIAFVREPGSKWLKDAKPGEPYVIKKNPNGERTEANAGGEFLVGYAPGTVPEILEPGEAKLIKAGSDVVLQMHYTASGSEAADRTKVGFVFAKEAPKERIMTLASGTSKFTIPAGDPNYRLDSSIKLAKEVKVVGFIPHMHLRGKDFEYRFVYPDGRTETVLSVPKYSFSWQLSYYPEKPFVLPAGTKVDCTAHYDNSANNPNNPDPKVDVHEGEQSWDEMMLGFFNIAFDAKMSPGDLFERKQRKAPNAD
jgi:mono/diheme cytochrome c family protein